MRIKATTSDFGESISSGEESSREYFLESRANSHKAKLKKKSPGTKVQDDPD
jgi:hypothetical protein